MDPVKKTQKKPRTPKPHGMGVKVAPRQPPSPVVDPVRPAAPSPELTDTPSLTDSAYARFVAEYNAAAAVRPELSPKDRRFVAEYLIDFNAARAARAIGSTAARSDQAGYEYLSKPEIAEAIAAGQRQQLARAGLTKERLLEELGYLVLVNIRDYFDPITGHAKHPQDLTLEQGAAIAGFEVLKRNLFPDDGPTDTIHKFKLWDKLKAIELYMKHRGMLVDKVEIKDTNADARVARLIAARKRLASK
jgi:phage terminase small subunit